MCSVLFVTLGCAKNEVDTDRMRSLLLAAGCTEVFDVAKADVAIVNTCSFLVAATEESLEATLALAEDAKAGLRKLPIIMCGCVPSRYGDELAPELPEVAAFVTVDDEDRIVTAVASVLHKPELLEAAAPTLYRTAEASFAFIKISDGCDRRCAFCAIPNIRGAYHSRERQEILDECAGLLAAGVRELILIGQDTGVWGHDLTGKPTLASLMRDVAALARPYNGWVRVLYLQPEGMTDELIATIRDTPEIVSYIDIPIQHCSSSLLKAMHRSGSASELHELFARLRREIPNITLRTTAMVAFPGESEEQFAELAAFLEEEAFDYCSIFTFSAEEGTEAALMDGQIPAELALERTQELIDIAEKNGFAATSSHVGETVELIIDGIEEGDEGFELIGHTKFQAPDSDGVVHISHGEASVGDIVQVKLVDSFCYELIGEIVS